MPKMTLLEITQDILSDMDSDNVNSINDTVEALQVAQIIKSTFFNIIDGREWPHLFKMFQLEASGTALKPTHMKLPTNVIDIEWIKYNYKDLADTKNKVTQVKYKTPDEFMFMLDARKSDDTNILLVVDDSGIPMNIKNDSDPLFYTSFDNEHIIFDAYDSVVDSTLQVSKTQCYGKVYPTWTMEDTFTADLPVQAFSYLLNEAKGTCMLRFKQTGDQKAEQASISQRRRMSTDAWILNQGVTYPNYGRKR